MPAPPTVGFTGKGAAINAIHVAFGGVAGNTLRYRVWRVAVGVRILVSGPTSVVIPGGGVYRTTVDLTTAGFDAVGVVTATQDDGVESTEAEDCEVLSPVDVFPTSALTLTPETDGRLEIAATSTFGSDYQFTIPAGAQSYPADVISYLLDPYAFGPTEPGVFVIGIRTAAPHRVRLGAGTAAVCYVFEAAVPTGYVEVITSPFGGQEYILAVWPPGGDTTHSIGTPTHAVTVTRLSATDAETDDLGPFDTLAAFDCGAPVVVPPAVAATSVAPALDTTRGGATVVVSSPPVVVLTDTRLDRPCTGATGTAGVPAGWTGAVTGSGVVRPGTAGLVLDSGAVAVSSASVLSDAAYQSLDVQVDLEVLAAPSVGGSGVGSGGALDVAGLELVASGGAEVLRLRVRNTATGLVVVGEAVSSGVVAGAGIVAAGVEVGVGGGVVTLRIVRDLARAWGFAGLRAADRRRAALGAFEQEEAVLAVLAWPVVGGPAAVRVVGLNGVGGAVAGGSPGRTLVRLTNIRWRSHATISDRLLVNKTDGPAALAGLATGDGGGGAASTGGGGDRLVGTVPAALVAEVGLADVTVFGPWGRAVLVDGFEYVLPAPKVLAGVGGAGSRLTVVQDGQLRTGDGSSGRPGGRT